MKLVAHVIEGLDYAFEIRPAPLQRSWMDATWGSFAYNCIPLVIANQYGWELLTPYSFIAQWNGGVDKKDVGIFCKGETGPPGKMGAVRSHFGHGILTFNVPCIFTTDPGVDLFVTGPTNRPKDGIAPQSAVIEADWNFAGQPMNWQFTRPYHTVHFEKGEPYCLIFPVQRGYLERFKPEAQELSGDLKRANRAWGDDRAEDTAKRTADPAWPFQKRYMRGLNIENEKIAPKDHKTRMKLRPFEMKEAAQSPERPASVSEK